jgi:sialic acid synthase
MANNMSFKFKYKAPKVIAEIGCNHKGGIEIAKELISMAKESGAGYVKFQKRNNKELLTKEQYNAAHPVPENSYGASYGEHRDFLEFNVSQHKELREYCDRIGIVYSTSVWDVTSAKEMITFEPEFLKVPSACNNNFKMLKVLRDDFSGQVQLSIGMTTKKEVEEIVSFFEETDQAKSRLLIYSCTSGYPVPAKDVALLEINWLYENYGDRVNEIGFSGHHLGVALDVAAYVLGARWIERHFTKDKTWKGTDHSASLEKKELTQLVDNLHDIYHALHYKEEEVLLIEQVQRDKLKHNSFNS